MVIFRENTEDIYAGIEYRSESDDAKKVIGFLESEMGVKKIRFPATSGVGIKPISSEGTGRLVRAAINYALENGRKSVTLVHKGNIMKFTEGAFRDWGYALAANEFREQTISERESWILGNREDNPDISIEDNARAVDPGYDLMTSDQQATLRAEVESVMNAIWDSHGDGQWKEKLLIKDTIADITLQQVLTRAKSFDVIATMNLNGDYLSDALAAQVGGIGIAPGGNINYETGPRDLRGDARDGTQVRRPGQSEPGLRDPVGALDVPTHEVERGGRAHRIEPREDHRAKARHL